MIQPPNTSATILAYYQEKIDLSASSIGQLKKIKFRISIARISSVFAGIILIYIFWPAYALVFTTLLLFSILFIFFVFKDADNTVLIKNKERLILINQTEINALLHNMGSYDEGLLYAEPEHAYAADLDLFGPSSLYQYLNRCQADQSGKLLADYLKKFMLPEAIIEKQEALKELADQKDWCQQFQSTAMENPLRFATEKKLEKWISLPQDEYDKPYWKWLILFYPLVSIGILILFITGLISTGAFTLCLIGFFAFSSWTSSKIQSVYALLSLIQPEMDSLYTQLDLIENKKFNSKFLNSLQKSLAWTAYPSASASMRVFHKLLARFDLRLNLIVFIFLNGFLLWDLRQMLSLNIWKKNNKTQLAEWFRVIAEMEVSISLASLVFNEPDWIFPEINENYFHLLAEETGHPLIPASQRILNSFEMNGTGKIALITGSNMAGKSTFLRTLGMNMVLAGMGSPVCAKKMQISRIQLVSSMRVADNLAEHTSTFYAELKKLKYIIDTVNLKEPVFIL